MKYTLNHVAIQTSDGLELPGLLYEPNERTNKVAIYLHGNGESSVFYKPRENKIIAEALHSKNISYFPFNNRGAGLIQRFKYFVDGKKLRKTYGMTYELIKECIIDINGAVSFLKSFGYEEFYLIGSSTGANKIVVYDYYSTLHNPFSKYILLAGGDDTGIYYEMLGKNKFEKALKLSQEKINDGKGLQLAPQYLVGDMLISYQSLYDTINPEGDYNIFPYYFKNMGRSRPVPTIKIKKELFREFKQINKPTLVIYGENDEYCFGASNAVSILKQVSKGKNNFTYNILPEADHGFTDREEELAKIIGDWL